MEKLLIVDDNAEILKQLKWGLSKNYHVLLAEDVETALKLFGKHSPKVVTLDLGLPPDVDGATEGMRCLDLILANNAKTKVIVLSGNEDRANALQAVQLGAYDYYRKPINLPELKVIIERAFSRVELEIENERLQSEVMQSQGAMHGIFGQCAAMEEIFATINKVAAADIPIMVMGENGTGKELVAHAIHAKSLRKSKPFIPINCGAIPDNLLEAELFGYEKGAFTGATCRVKGKVEFAEGGTLFLDEIGELPLPLQVKMLRFLQEKTIQRVGGREDIVVDARIVAATNIDIEKAIQDNLFREDLYYRISVITLTLPPLRERGDDIMILANLFLNRYLAEYGKKISGFSSSAKQAIKSYHWPGNVRELENKIKRAILMADNAFLAPIDLDLDDGGDGTDESSEPDVSNLNVSNLTIKEARDKLERNMLLSALERYDGVVVKAAEELGVSRPTFYDMLKKHAINKVGK